MVQNMLGRIADSVVKSVGLRRSLTELSREFSLMRVHRRGVALAKSYRGRTGLKLNIGSGQWAQFKAGLG
jgi:hypothetical protein